MDTTAELQEDTADEYGSCGKLVSENIAWNDVLDSGLSAAEIFEPLEGSCNAPVVWDAILAGSGRITPEAGDSDLTVTLKFDRESLSLQHYVGAAEPARESCLKPYLFGQADVNITSADGVFDDSGRVSVRYSDEDGIAPACLTIWIDQIGGSLSVKSAENETVSLVYELSGADEACAGDILLVVATGVDSDFEQTTTVPLGYWSGTGCYLGNTPVNLDASRDDGRSVRECFDDIFGDQRFEAAWDNGEETSLAITAELDGIYGCREDDGRVSIPALITYGTEDNNLELRTVLGIADVEFSDADLVRAAGIYFADYRSCENESDEIGYGFGDCSTLSGVIVQLDMGWSEGDHWTVSNEAIVVNEYDLGTYIFGAPDRSRRLVPTI